MSNSIQCTKCKLWIHKRCSGVCGKLSGLLDYLCCRCKSGRDDEDCEKTVKFGRDEIEVVKEFCYLGDMLGQDGDVRRAVTARIRAGWKKFRELSGTLCGKILSSKLKGRLYKACVRSVMSYGAECWSMKKADVRRMESTEMRMVRMMCGKTLRDKVPSIMLRERMGIEDIEEHLREYRLRWLGHLERMNPEDLVRRVRKENIVGRKKRGRPKKSWEDVVKEDMVKRNLKVEDAQMWEKWKRRC